MPIKINRCAHWRLAQPFIYLYPFSVSCVQSKTIRLFFSLDLVWRNTKKRNEKQNDKKIEKKNSKLKRLRWQPEQRRRRWLPPPWTTLTSLATMTATWEKSSGTWNAHIEKVQIFQLILCQSSVTHAEKRACRIEESAFFLSITVFTTSTLQFQFSWRIVFYWVNAFAPMNLKYQPTVTMSMFCYENDSHKSIKKCENKVEISRRSCVCLLRCSRFF